MTESQDALWAISLTFRKGVLGWVASNLYIPHCHCCLRSLETTHPGLILQVILEYHSISKRYWSRARDVWLGPSYLRLPHSQYIFQIFTDHKGELEEKLGSFRLLGELSWTRSPEVKQWTDPPGLTIGFRAWLPGSAGWWEKQWLQMKRPEEQTLMDWEVLCTSDFSFLPTVKRCKGLFVFFQVKNRLL